MQPTLLTLTSIALLAVAALPAAAGTTLFHPLLADPREDQLRLHITSFTQDYRYGTDVTDTTTVPGIENDVRGTQFEFGVGRTFRGPVMSLVGAAGSGWQIVLPAGIFTTFQRVGAQLINVSDYQFGIGVDARWLGDPAAEAPGTVIETRLALYHRSSHLADEYVTLARFGRNQEGIDTTLLSKVPPIKRVEVSYEALRGVASIEWPLVPDAPTTLRLYGGGEIKVPIARREPRRMKAASAQAGLELHLSGRRAPRPIPWLEGLGRMFGAEQLGVSGLGALDVRWSRPFEFSGCDNPFGDEEVWTPRLYSTCPYGSERKLAGSWHGMVGARFGPATPGVTSAVLLSLDWYHGTSPYGPFQDQRFSYHPRWFFVPSVTLQLW